MCKDEQCENKDDLYVHIKHGEDGVSEEINMPASWKEHFEKLQLESEQPSKEVKVKDKRPDKTIWSRKFLCANTDCRDFIELHEHHCTIDPIVPHLAISYCQARGILQEEGLYRDEDYTFQEYRHIHLPKNERRGGC